MQILNLHNFFHLRNIGIIFEYPVKYNHTFFYICHFLLAKICINTWESAPDL